MHVLHRPVEPAVECRRSTIRFERPVGQQRRFTNPIRWISGRGMKNELGRFAAVGVALNNEDDSDPIYVVTIVRQHCFLTLSSQSH